MKNFMVANFIPNKKHSFDDTNIILKVQINNSLELGWDANDIILLTNFDYKFMGIEAITKNMNEYCLTGSKMFGMKYLFDNDLVDDVIWAHDLDAWQNAHFDCPDFKDVGASQYSRPKFNGGSIFWKKSSKDIVYRIIDEIVKNKENKEEPTLNKIFKSKEYKNRVTVLNNTFNVGCSGYVERWYRSDKPVRVCHFHPTNKIAWETHRLDRNGIGFQGISDRLESLLRRYYPNIATELSEKGKKAQKEKAKKYEHFIKSNK